MKKSAYIVAVILCFAIILIYSGGNDKKGSTGPTLPSDDETIISDNSTVVEKEKKLTLYSVTGNTITYSFTGKSHDISIGDILVSSEGDGYLPKIIEWLTIIHETKIQSRK